jgi:hypothetical protein
MNMAPIVSRRIMLIETLDGYMFWVCVATFIIMMGAAFIDRKKRPNLRFGVEMVYILMGMGLMLYIAWRMWMIFHIYDLP